MDLEIGIKHAHEIRIQDVSGKLRSKMCLKIITIKEVSQYYHDKEVSQYYHD